MPRASDGKLNMWETVAVLVLTACLSFNDSNGPVHYIVALSMLLAQSILSDDDKHFWIPKANLPSMIVAFYDPRLYGLGVIAISLLCAERTSFTKIKSRKGEIKVVEHSASFVPQGWKQHSIWNSVGIVYIDILKSSMELEYIGKVDFNKPVLDEFTACENLRNASSYSKAVWLSTKIIPWFALSVVSFIVGGDVGFLIYVVFAVLYNGSYTEESQFSSKDAKQTKNIQLEDGIYRIRLTPFGVSIPQGIGYIENGTLYTRLHVTHGNAINIDGVTYKPNYVNPVTDNVVYGNEGTFMRVEDGEEVLVTLAGTQSTTVMHYKSRVIVNEDGAMFFRGAKSSPGSSGSPVFKLTQEEVTDKTGTSIRKKYTYVGSIGWYWDRDTNEPSKKETRVGTEAIINERFSNSASLPMNKGEIRQVFKHPGSGKTHIDLPDYTRQGLHLYGRVYITGPNKTVCEEIYRSLKNNIPEDEANVSLVMSGATRSERGNPSLRKIVVAAHPTMLAMLTGGEPSVTQPGLWIIDEAHFQDAKTMMLKDFLRSLVSKSKRRSLVEMTATGYNIQTKKLVIKDGSNYPIEDIIMESQDMLKDIYIRPGKTLVFCTSVKGREPTSIDSLFRNLRSTKKNVVPLHRGTFDRNYAKAAEITEGVVLTSDIAECGANLGTIDTVYDFQTSPKPCINGNQVAIVNRPIDRSQRVQRRGRTGRRASGTYIHPNVNLDDYDMSRAEHFDRAVFARSLQIDILDPQPVKSHDPEFTLSLEQIAAWLRISESSINSPYTVYNYVDTKGNIRSKQQLEHMAREMLRGDEVIVKHESTGADVHVSFWDARDAQPLQALLDLMLVNTSNRSVNKVINDIAFSIKHATAQGLKRLFATSKYDEWDDHKDPDDEDDGCIEL